MKPYACVMCNEKSPTVDSYLCGECADSIGVTSENIRHAYRFMLQTGKAFIETAELEQSGKEQPLVSPKAIYWSPMVHFHNARRFNYYSKLSHMVVDIEGDIVECGVGRGQSLMMWATLAFDEKIKRNVWGFDSFEGVPESTIEDMRDNGEVLMAKAPADKDMLKEFVSVIASYGLPAIWINSHLFIVRGYFDKTLSLYTGDGIAILHIDANLYGSYKVALNALFPKVAEGGIICFDEYKTTWDINQFPGAYKAIDEFLEENKLKILQDREYGKYYTVKEWP